MNFDSSHGHLIKQTKKNVSILKLKLNLTLIEALLKYVCYLLTKEN